MKKLLTYILYLFSIHIVYISGANAQIVNNSGSTAADSISLPFYLLDSNGYNTQLLASTDTVFLVVFRPNGVIAFEDSIPQGNARISDNNVSTNIGQYALKLAAADIDGAGADGVFSYTIITDDESLDLETVVRGTFQLYQNSDFNVWALRIQDSLQGVIDSLQNQDNWIAQQTEVANIDGWNPITDNDSLIVDASTLVDDNFGINWADVSGQAAAVSLSATDINIVNFVAAGGITGASIASNAVDADAFATDAVDEIAEQVNDSVWLALLVDYDNAVGSFGDSAQTWGAAGSGSTDSGLVARIGKRIWGIAQGAGSDSLTVAQRTVTGRGGWVDSNRTEQGGIAGANRTWNVYVFDTSGTDTPIPNANVDVQLTNGTVKLRGTTDASGLVTFTVTDGPWVLVSQETGYVLNNLNKTISTNSADTIKGYDIIVGTPSSPALCRVYGYVYSVGAIPDEGAGVAAFLPAGVARSGNLIISPFSISTITDSLGYFALDLIRSDSLVPAGSMYDLVINRKDGTIVHKRVSVPDQSSWLLQW